jgi:hypothetical protein
MEGADRDRVLSDLESALENAEARRSAQVERAIV